MKYRRVVAGLDVAVRVGPGSDRLEVVADLLRGEPLRAPERHARDETRHAALVVFLQHGTGLHRQPQLGAVRRFGGAPDVVLQPVAEGAAADGGVERQRGAGRQRPRLRGCRDRGHAEERQRCKKNAPESGAGQRHMRK